MQNLSHFAPWHFIQAPEECAFAANAFRREDVGNREVFVFARRQDCDDFAGLQIVDGRITNKVLYFHPVFCRDTLPTPKTWDIVRATYDDVFVFVAHRVVPDMKDWAPMEDAAEFEE